MLQCFSILPYGGHNCFVELNTEKDLYSKSFPNFRIN